jgi:Phasin protein
MSQMKSLNSAVSVVTMAVHHRGCDVAKESDISIKRDVAKTHRVAKRRGVAKAEDGANIGTTLENDVFKGDEGVESDRSEGDAGAQGTEVAQVDMTQGDEDAQVIKANMNEVYMVATGDEGNEVVKTETSERNGTTEVLTISDLDYFHSSKVQPDVATTTATSVTAILQAIVAERTDYWKKSIDNRLTLVQKLLGAKSFDSAIQIQSEYANKFCDGFSAHTTKMHKFYSNLAKAAFKPIEVLAD